MKTTFFVPLLFFLFGSCTSAFSPRESTTVPSSPEKDYTLVHQAEDLEHEIKQMHAEISLLQEQLFQRAEEQKDLDEEYEKIEEKQKIWEGKLSHLEREVAHYTALLQQFKGEEEQRKAQIEQLHRELKQLVELVKGTVSSSGEELSYEVKKGDTLLKISRKYGVTVEALRHANNIFSDSIFPGQKLKIPSK